MLLLEPKKELTRLSMWDIDRIQIWLAEIETRAKALQKFLVWISPTSNK
jgi:hypothetical protein